MRVGCDEASQQVDAYAVGALDVDDARALEGHLAGCAACAALLIHAQSTAASIALAVPLVSSGPALKARVIASAAVLRDARAPARRRWWPAAAAAAIVIGVAGFAWGSVAQRRANDQSNAAAGLRRAATAQSAEVATVRTQLVQVSAQSQALGAAARAQDDIADLVSQPDLVRIPMTGTAAAPSASARYLWSDASEMGALVASKLPPLPADKQYELWAVYPDRRWAPAGSFSVDDSGRGRLIVRHPDDPAAPDAAAPLWFCVTVEPAGGALQASGEMVLRSPSR